ncbi:MAG: glycoside hydrolase family 32 protein [Candidatus Brocadiia bacterium]|nr:glycoside hydrolase family 32 protein [Candidatus Brocadiia bacterium]
MDPLTTPGSILGEGVNIGTYADHRFHPEEHGRMNFGPFGHGGLNAPITFEDAAGRRIFIGWIGEGRPEEVQRASGWSGVMSLPRVLSLSGDGALLVGPAPELEVLRGDHCRCGDIPIPPRSNVFLQDVRGECLEIGAEMEPDDAGEVGIKVRCSPRCEEQTLISYNHAEKCLSLDVGRSSLSPDVEDRGAECGPLELAEGESLKLRIFLDRSVVEVFANGRLCLTKRIYPSRSDSLGVALFARGGRAKLRSMDAWHMSSIWPAGEEG